MSTLKRISMAGADVAVTDAEIADLVLEYAMFLGRVGTTDSVTVPVVGPGEPTVDFLLGPASQIVLSGSNEPSEADLHGVEDAKAHLRQRINHVSGRAPLAHESEPVVDASEAFPDLDAFR
jgi:hypothetical protein